MKSFITCLMVFAAVHINNKTGSATASKENYTPAGNIFIITLDGFRWQELFTGADPALINNENYTPDTATMKMLYWAPSAEGRRKKLLPFFWNVIGVKGQLYGNRNWNNKVNSSNVYSISYPGYNEIFTGNADITISSNNRNTNPHINILEYLNTKESFKGKVAAFTSWDVFPFIFNEKRSNIIVNSGYENMDDDNPGSFQHLINKVQDVAIYNKTATRHDQLTFLTAREYIQEHKPRVIYLGLGETDEAAHDERYDLYLEKAAEADRMIAGLWHWVQTTAGYKNNSTFIITTDHGRGMKSGSWTNHGAFINGSSQTWLAVMGPNIEAAGEVKEDQQIYQKQLAQTIAALVGEEFLSAEPVAAAVSFR